MMDVKIRSIAHEGIELLIEYHACFAYSEFGDQGNACYKPYRDDDLDVVNEMIAAIRTEMPKYSERHEKLSEAVARDIGAKWVSYDWLCKVFARILVGAEDIDNLKKKCEFARLVRQKVEENVIRNGR